MVPKICSIPECGKPHNAKWLCGVHYMRQKNHGTALWEPTKKPEFCSIEGCAKKRHSKGLCSMHNHRRISHGNPLHTKTIVGDDDARFESKINKTDACWLWTGKPTPLGYGSIRINGRDVRAHRFSYEKYVGKIPEGMEIDHICRNRICVNPKHLRAATRKQNIENHTGARSDSKTGVRGVSRKSRDGKYEASVQHNGKRYYVGIFTDITEAEAAVIAKRNELFTHNDLDRI